MNHSHLSRDESRRLNLNDDVVYLCRRLGPLHQGHPGRSRSLVPHNNRLHPRNLPASSSRPQQPGPPISNEIIAGPNGLPDLSAGKIR
jgi:hypothetical protein